MKKLIATVATTFMSMTAMAHPGHSQHVHVTESISIDVLASIVAVALIAGTAMLLRSKKANV